MEPLPNNRFKAPFFLVCAVVAAILAFTGHDMLLMAPVAVLSLISAGVVQADG